LIMMFNFLACGNVLWTYKPNKKDSVECPIRPYDKIHKIAFKIISSGCYQIIFAAGRELISVQLVNSQFQNAFASHISDWICSVNIHNTNEFSFLTKHNIAVLASIDLTNKSLKVLKKSRLIDKATLYCSLLSGNSWNETVIFCGTALGELLVWSPIDCPGMILSRKMAHNGVIFSIDLKMKVLTTTSDDRSIKYWSFDKCQDGKGYSIEEKKSFFGHTSRIFCCKIIHHEEKELIVSGGEDGTICLWDLTGNMVWKKKSCTGATIWSIDYDSFSQSIYVSTSNGNVFRYQLKVDVVEEKGLEITDTKTVVKFKYFNEGKIIMFQDYSVEVFQENTKKIHKFQLDTCNLMKTYENIVVLASKTTLFLLQVAQTDAKMETLDLKANFQEFSMIRSIHFFHENNFLICTNNGLCMQFSPKEMAVQNVKYLLPLCTERFTTAAFQHNEFTILGDRCGHLHLYLNPAGG
jgi:WD40 repeat protein